MKRRIQTKRNIAVWWTAMLVWAWGLAPIASAKKPIKPDPDPPEPARFTLQAFGDCTASDFNDAGHVVGEVSHDYEGFHAFLLIPVYDPTKGELVWFQDLNGDGINDLLENLDPLGTNYSWASAVNDFDEVIGSFWEIGGPEHAFIWDRSNGMIDLGTLGGDSDWSVGRAINGSRQVVGQTCGAVAGFPAFFWEDSNANGQSDPGEMIDLGTLGGTVSDANFIHDSGLVLGEADLINGDAHAFLIVPEDTNGDNIADTWFRDDSPADGINDLMIDLGTLGGAESWAHAMNDSGQIVGTAQIANRDAVRAFLLTPVDENGSLVWFQDSDGDGINDLMTNLGVLDGDTGSSAHDLNNAGQVVGDSRTVKGSRPGHTKVTRNPFLWEDGQMKNLNELTDSEIVVGGSRINNAGQILSAYHILLPLPAAP